MRLIRTALAAALVLICASASAQYVTNGAIYPLVNGAATWVLRGTEPAALDYDFSNGRYWQRGYGQRNDATPFITTSRASTGYASDTAGNWYSFANNVPRITNQGLLVEESRTNSIRNNSMQGAVAGSPGTLPTNWSVTSLGALTRQIVGTGTENGIDYIDIRFSGTTSTTDVDVGFESGTQISASQNQIWDGTVFATLVGGSTTNITNARIILIEADSGGSTLGASTTNFTPTAGNLGLARKEVSRTMASASTAHVYTRLDVLFSSGVAVDITLRIGWPQLELGSFATSPIRTTNAAVTRAADVITVTNVPVFGSAYTAYGAATPAAPNTANNQFLISIDAGSDNDRFILYRSSGGAHVFNSSGGSGGDISAGTWNQGVFGKIAGTTSASDQAASFNGGAIGTTSGALPVGANAVRIGSSLTTAQFFNGTVPRIAIWPTTRQPDATLTALTQ